MNKPHSGHVLALLAFLILALGTHPASAADLEGTLMLFDGKRLANAKDVAMSVIYYTPDAGVSEPPTPETLEIATVRKQFLPRVLAVPKGSEVRFPNQDPILHNVFSVSKGNAFDLGLYKGDQVGETRFDTPGVARVFCNVHHSMVAHVLVLETPYYTTPERDGSFRLENLPEGPGTLTVWHERSDAQDVSLTIPQSEPITVRLKISKPRVPKHLNKAGKRYKRRGRNDSY